MAERDGASTPAGRDRARERRRRAVRRRRTAAAGAAGFALLLGLIAGAVGGGGGGERDGARPPRLPELPRGGRELFPDHRVVAFYGAPQDEELGALGVGSPDDAARRLRRQARPYARGGRRVMPAFELIATIANSTPGDDGRYSSRQRPEVIRRYLRAARRARALLILDVQPGRREFMEEVEALEPFLAEPDVGLALDPEWQVGPGEVPGQQIGSTDAETVNRVSGYLAGLVARGRLPEKPLVIHQFTRDMIEDIEQLQPRPGVATVLNVDGFGAREVKMAKYRDFTGAAPRFLLEGLKLFYKEDTNLLGPRQVLGLDPQPDFIVYE